MKKDKKLNFKSWKSKEWETYLSNFDVEAVEDFLDQPETVELMTTEDYEDGFSNLIGQNYTPHLGKLCLAIIEQLTPLQKNVINQIFWNSKNLSEISICLGISRVAVSKIRNRALAQIRKKLQIVQLNETNRNEFKNSQAIEVQQII